MRCSRSRSRSAARLPRALASARVVAAQLAGGALHVLGNLLELAARLLTLALRAFSCLTALPALPLPAALAALLALPTLTALLALATLLTLTLGTALPPLVRLASLLPLLKLPGQFLRLAAQLALLAGQTFKLPLQLLRGRRLAVFRQLLLTLVERILPARELLDLLEGIVFLRSLVASFRNGPGVS